MPWSCFTDDEGVTSARVATLIAAIDPFNYPCDHPEGILDGTAGSCLQPSETSNERTKEMGQIGKWIHQSFREVSLQQVRGRRSRFTTALPLGSPQLPGRGRAEVHGLLDRELLRARSRPVPWATALPRHP